MTRARTPTCCRASAWCAAATRVSDASTRRQAGRLEPDRLRFATRPRATGRSGFAAPRIDLASSMSVPLANSAARLDLVPTAKLRAGINYGNVILAAKDPASGELRGVHVDLARELARAGWAFLRAAWPAMKPPAGWSKG